MITVTNILVFLSLTLVGGFLNRWRGGWQISWLKITDHGFKRILVCFVPMIALCLPFKDYIPWWTWVVSYLLFLIIGLIPGWGSWFFIGRAEDSWKHNADAFWAEWISYLVYGAKWIPKNHGLLEDEYKKLKSRFNLKDSPDGNVRPLDWRIKMERFAMNIRGLGFTVPASLFLFITLLLMHHKCIWQLFFVFPLGFLMGYLYEIGFFINTKKLPNWLEMSTNIGEFLTGSIILGGGLFILSLHASQYIL